eukprot:m.92859 g.92859  ORF g.92859 m.92859 type:complete len:76 (-) comp9977_c0_seq1:247-474(-)
MSRWMLLSPTNYMSERSLNDDRRHHTNNMHSSHQKFETFGFENHVNLFIYDLLLLSGSAVTNNSAYQWYCAPWWW